MDYGYLRNEIDPNFFFKKVQKFNELPLPSLFSVVALVLFSPGPNVIKLFLSVIYRFS
jgi:hypothetical protein